MIDVLKLATDNYSVIFPIQDSDIDQLLNDEDFVSIILNKKSIIKLNNNKFYFILFIFKFFN